MAAYGFEEGSGTTTADASGNGNTGTIVNATWTATGKYGEALQFNGTNARVDIPDAASLHLSTGMTLEAWVNPRSSTSAWRDVDLQGQRQLLPRGDLDERERAGRRRRSSAARTATPTAPPRSPPNTLGVSRVTYDGANVRLYVNGTLVATTPKTGAITTSTNPLQIGGDSIYGQYFNGLIDEVRIYNAALTAAQIQTDMTTPIAGGGAPDTQPPSAPGTLSATAANAGEIDLSWGAATDNVGVTGYRIERCQGAGCTNFAQIAHHRPARRYKRHRRSPPRRATATASARPTRAGNLGPYSNIASATTTRGRDVGPGGGVWVRRGVGDDGRGRVGQRQHRHVANATWTTAGKYGRAIEFNGTNAPSTSPTRRRCTSRPG